MDDIEKELQEKLIEKDTNISAEITDELPAVNTEIKETPKKSKKVRSAAQIAAFEKAKIKRKENFEKRKLDRETKITTHDNNDLVQPVIVKKEIKKENPQPSYHHPQPIINNYYYGTNDYAEPPSHRKKGRKKKQVIIESSSSSDEEIVEKPPTPPPRQAQQTNNNQEKVTNQLRFNFV
tara:strand:- start:716 stop:1252 length:537 start_codon:yes stop_codon:yes gene_type:complete